MDGVTADEDFFDELRPLCKVCLDGWNLLEGNVTKAVPGSRKSGMLHPNIMNLFAAHVPQVIE